MGLAEAILASDTAGVARLLRASPDLARASFAEGATRSDPQAHWLEKIGHYVYKGDTALHVAAAVYRHGIAGQLVDTGADVRAQSPWRRAAALRRRWGPRIAALES